MQELAKQFSNLTPDEQVNLAIIAVERLYQDGKTGEARDLAKRFSDKALVIEAWCLYREKKFSECVEVLSTAPESEKVLELWAYLSAYKMTGFWNEDRLLEVLAKLPKDSTNLNNAKLISAREPDSKLNREEIFNQLAPWVASLDRSLATVEQSNVLHNLARLALAKAQTEEGSQRDAELKRALDFIDYAIEAYGTRTNFHHRGAAHYWRSVILENTGRTYDAWQAGQDSLSAYQKQLDMAPDNKEWQTRLAGAQKRARELAEKLSM